MNMKTPVVVVRGCDTFVAYPPTTPENVVVFGKNSDRPHGEKQSIRLYPAVRQPTSSSSSGSDATSSCALLKCTYISIPDVPVRHAVLLSQIDWMWGAEMGANEHGVVIGNEAVWTKVEIVPEERRLLGMDLVRLGLERATTSDEALDVITSLLEEHGQGGPCAEDDEDFTYHNSFLIADRNHAWILETAGKHWVAQKFTQGSRNISNGLTIRTDYDRSSSGLHKYAKEHGLWDGQGSLDFAKCFSSGGVDLSPYSRQACGRNLLTKHDNKHSLDVKAMMEILRDHEGGICMHGSFETTASMVSELRKDEPGTSSTTAKHWMTGKPYPCESEFILQEFP